MAIRSFRVFLPVFLAVFLGLALGDAALADASSRGTTEPGHVVSGQIENDLFGNGADRHYTHGTRLSYLYEGEVPGIVAEGARAVPFFGEGRRLRFEVSLTQSIFTPDDITNPDLITDDRPYAGWLSLGLGVFTHHRVDDLGRPRRIDSLSLNLGVVGPSALADRTQTWWHEVIDTRKPRGWDHQLKDEPGIVLEYERQYPMCLVADCGADLSVLGSNFGVDIAPHLGGALGNVFTHLNVGGTLRFGNDLAHDEGLPRIRPSLPGSGYFRPARPFAWYVFAGVEGRAVARNIFLDGNTFRDSHRVDKKHFVGDVQVGVAFTIRHVRLSFTNIWRSREFDGQDEVDEFGAVTMSVSF